MVYGIVWVVGFFVYFVVVFPAVYLVLGLH